MTSNRNDIWLGLGTIAFGVFLLVYAIPNFITSPSNVRALVLSPTFWPTIVAALIILLGAALTISRMFGPPITPSEPAQALEQTTEENVHSTLRIGATGILMVMLVWATPVIGLVLATGLMFALIAIIIVSPRPVTSIITAIVLPLVLYMFFAHVAGVSVPQGRFLILP